MHCSQDNATKALIIMVNEKMTFSQQTDTSKWENFGKELLIPMDGNKFSKIDPNWDASRPPLNSLVLPGTGASGFNFHTKLSLK